MKVISDRGAAERTFRQARQDASAWLTWGPTRAWYLAWVTRDGNIESALLLDPAETERLSEIKRTFRARLERPTDDDRAQRSYDESDAMPVVVLSIADYHDGTYSGAGYGAFGQPAHRCRPARDLRERAGADLAPPDTSVL